MRLLDLFSGIGGFHLGFERAGFEFDYVGFAEVDKYASAVYKYNNPFAEELGDVKSIRSKNLPKIDIITFGSPCQDFSIAGKRAGATEGTRSSLIWEAIRLITECKPRIFVWENVKGTFSSNNGADFWAIIQAFTNIGSYRLEWQLLNTRWFPKTPQNRERIYLVGYTGNRGGRSVFPIGEDGGNNVKSQETKRRTGKRFRSKDYSTALRAKESRSGCDTLIHEMDKIQTFTERSFDGKDKINIIGNLKGDGGHECHNVHSTKGLAPTVRHNHGKVTMIDVQTAIRRLTPRECMRLQGFPDNHNEFGLLNGKKVVISDTQRYKQAGNAVTVDVVAAVARAIKLVLDEK